MEDPQPSSTSRMRLKNDMLGPVSVVQHNGNQNLLSPENSTTTTTTLYSDNYNLTNTVDALSNNRQINQINQNNIEFENVTSNQQQLNNLLSARRFVDNDVQTDQRRQDTLQWCNSINTIQYQKQQALVTNNTPNNISSEAVYQNGKNPQLFNNINNTLAASLRSAPAHPKQQEQTRTSTRSIRSIRSTGASSVCSESSPDDSLLDYEEAQQSCSSVDTSPQDEDRGFDLSDTESLSDVENISGDNNHHLQPRGIVNPNYPGFQHLAHTLDYTIKVCSDTDFTDDDLDLDETAVKTNTCDVNNINNNNNNEHDIEYKIDSVNRLDSVENIQKVFYDKPKLNIPLEFEATDLSEKQNNLVDSANEEAEAEASSSNSSSEDFEGNLPDSENSEPEPNETNEPYKNININVTLKEEAIGGDEDPPQKSNNNLEVNPNLPESISTADIVGNFGAELEQEIGRIVSRETEQRVEQELEEAVEKLTVASDLSPHALKYNIEPNSNEPFEKSEPVQINTIETLEPIVIKQTFEPEEAKETEETLELHPPLKPILFQQQIEEDEGIELQDLQPKLVKEMADIKVARVCSTETLTLKMNQPYVKENINTKTADAFLSEVRDDLPDLKLDKILHTTNDILKGNYERMEVCEVKTEKPRRDSNRELEETAASTRMMVEEIEKYCKEEKTKDDMEKDEDSTVPRKKEKMEINYVKKRRDSSQQIASLITIPRRELGGRNRDNLANRRSVPAAREKKKMNPELLGGFDVYNIETAMPKIDLDAIESHLKAAREEERRRRTDREEIRRRLAMGNEEDYYNGCDRPGRKPSLQARLQSGMNLQICFMNETASDTESPSSDSESPISEKFNSMPTKHSPRNAIKHHKILTPNQKSHQPRPVSLPLGTTPPLLQPFSQPMTEADFFARQARLQTEARMALAQAKEMAHMQMEVERQRQKKSPITEMIRSSLEKVGIPFPEERRRVSRQILTEMNVAQLQVIVNDLHTQIETLNENLVRFLMNRDDLHMEQDSMLVDIEDLTRYLGAKEQTVKEQKSTQNNNIPPPSPAPASPLTAINNTVKPRLHRIASLVKK